MNEFAVSNELLIRLLCFAGVFAAVTAWELAARRRTRTVSRWLRWPGNLEITLINTALVRVLAPTGVLGVALASQVWGFGVFNQLAVPSWLGIVLAVLILDLVVYLQHVMFHAVPALWRLHRVHHSDIEFDVTTGVRFHPLEILISFAIKLGVVVALGAPPLAMLIFEVLLNATSMFNHANARIPGTLDRMLRWFMVTPDMHRVHHSIYPLETNSNFGFNLPWWDRMLGTYRVQPVDGHEEMGIGIDGFRGAAESRLDRLLIQPARGGSRDYLINRGGG